MLAGLLLRTGLLLSLRGEVLESGLLSYYWPGDSTGTGSVLACDRPKRRRFYRRGSVHVAMRTWYRLGCGTEVLLCASDTSRCALAPVLDSGPWGIVRGPLRNARAEGRWRRPRSAVEANTWLRALPEGWRFRGVADLSVALWKKLGRPLPLTQISIYRLRR